MATHSTQKAPHPFRVKAGRSYGVWRPVGLALGAAAAAGLAVWLWSVRGPDSADPVETLTAQMRAAADGRAVPAVHAFGGRLNVQFIGQKAAVQAFDLPAKACVQAGWRLSKSGMVIVGGVLAQRLSAAKLTEMCGGGATITWVPD